MRAQCSSSPGLSTALTLPLWVTPWGRQRLWSTKPTSTLIPVTLGVNLSAAGPSYHVSHLCPETDLFKISRWRETGRDADCFCGAAKSMAWKRSGAPHAFCLILYNPVSNGKGRAEIPWDPPQHWLVFNLSPQMTWNQSWIPIPVI